MSGGETTDECAATDRPNPVSGFPALTLHQPWATLCMTMTPCVECTRQNCPRDVRRDCQCCRGAMVKRYETRSFRAPSTIIGRRIWIHAANRHPSPVSKEDEDSVPLPLGVLVGSAIIGQPLPIEGLGDHHPEPSDESLEHGTVVYLYPQEDELLLVNRFANPTTETHIDDQLPYGDWTPGRWAWPLLDPWPLREPIPAKGRQGVHYVPYDPEDYR